MATKTKSTSTSKSAPRTAPAPKPTRAKPAAKAETGTPKAAPKPAARQNPVVVSKSNGLQTFFRDDPGYVKAVAALKDGFVASTRKGNSDLPQFHLHRISGGVLCGTAARAPSNGSFTGRYVKMVARTPAALLKYKALNFEGRPLHLCHCCDGVKID